MLLNNFLRKKNKLQSDKSVSSKPEIFLFNYFVSAVIVLVVNIVLVVYIIGMIHNVIVVGVWVTGTIHTVVVVVGGGVWAITAILEDGIAVVDGGWVDKSMVP